MKNWIKNTLVVSGVSALLFTGGIVGYNLLSPQSVGASDEVTMELFNDLKAKVETLETQLDTANDKIIELTNADVTINTEIDTVSSKIDTEVAKVNTTINTFKTELTNKTSINTTNISKIVSWQDKLDSLQADPYAYTQSYIWAKMREFRKSQ